MNGSSDQDSEFKPVIVGFLCNWCAYAGADLAGTSRIQYPPNIRIIRVMCSGRVDPVFILEALINGADGVLVAGCHLPSDCHYLTGNIQAEKRMLLLKKMLTQLGIEPQRLRLEWISASEGDKFASVVTDMVAELKQIGPSPLKANTQEWTGKKD
jgi:F420-non-reducing hydrogenase iron-sulfur subunit